MNMCGLSLYIKNKIRVYGFILFVNGCWYGIYSPVGTHMFLT
jgi:hypothetical protein